MMKLKWQLAWRQARLTPRNLGDCNTILANQGGYLYGWALQLLARRDRVVINW
jgi:hypothetical protein